ncbi:MAG: class I fructose-bisphosphate aldolase [Pirellulaceae bacterium]
MDLGKAIRLARLFSHASGRFCSVAVDHFIGYQAGVPEGLRDLRSTLNVLVAGRPDAITMHGGVARTCWLPFAGRVPLIIQSIIGRPDDTADEHLVTPEDAARLGADAFATCAFVRGSTEAVHLRRVADCVRDAERLGIPVIVHTYPRRSAGSDVEVSYAPEDIAWAVRCGVECGVDVIKVPYCGDQAAYAQIVRECPVPVVAAGGPKAESLKAALAMAAEVVASGAKGMTIGRNIWGFPQVGAALSAFKLVIHGRLAPDEALDKAGLQ